MINRTFILGIVFLVCCGFVPSARADEQQNFPTSSWERYKVITENNVFLRNRSRPVARTAESAAAVRRPRLALVLTGIVRQGEEYIAFLEDTRAGTTSRVRANEALAEGRIVKIALDHLEFEKEGKTTKVELGEELDGGPSGETSASASPEAAPGTPQTTTGGGTADERALLEKLRQRRQKELGK